MVNYAILTMDPPHLPPDTLQTHGEHREQLSFILQIGFISRRRGIIFRRIIFKIIEVKERILINAAEI